jgi:hypothetical protein
MERNDMAPPEATTYQTVLEIVRTWSPIKRYTLVQDVLRTLAPEETTPQHKKKTLARALGLLATDQPPPSDAEIEQWLDEHRMEKYG